MNLGLDAVVVVEHPTCFSFPVFIPTKTESGKCQDYNHALPAPRAGLRRAHHWHAGRLHREDGRVGISARARGEGLRGRGAERLGGGRRGTTSPACWPCGAPRRGFY